MACWQVVVMPDGYRVTLDDEFDNYTPDQLFGSVLNGVGEYGERVTVSGNHITRASHRIDPAVLEQRPVAVFGDA